VTAPTSVLLRKGRVKPLIIENDVRLEKLSEGRKGAGCPDVPQRCVLEMTQRQVLLPEDSEQVAYGAGLA
jgi:hypothetical protein